MINDIIAIVNTIEMVYEMFEVDTESLGDVIDYYARMTASISAEDKKHFNREAGKQTVLLSYLLQKSLFYNEATLEGELDFTEDALDVIEMLTDNKNVSNAITRMDDLISEIQQQEDRRSTLSYRLIRIMIVMVVFGNFINASVVASFVLQNC